MTLLKSEVGVALLLVSAIGACSGSGTKTNANSGGTGGQAVTSGGGASPGGTGGTLAAVGGNAGTAVGGAMANVAGGGVGTGGAGGSGGGGAGGVGTGGTGSSAAGASGAAGSAGAGAGAGGTQGVGCAGAALCWDFEEGTIPTGWVTTRPMDFNGSIAVDNSKPHGGTFSLHMADLSGGVVAQAGGPKKSMQYWLPDNFGPVMWGRAYVYTTPEAPQSHAGFFNARYPIPNAAATSQDYCNGAPPCVPMDWYEVASYQGKYMSIWHTPEPPGFPEWVKVSDTPLALDAWKCVEWQFDATNGAMPTPADPKVWLEGTELAWPMEFTFDNSGTDKPTRPTQEKGTNFTMIETGVVMYQGLVTVTNWWIDDLAIGPERIGCN